MGWSPFSDLVFADCCTFSPPPEAPQWLRRHPALTQDNTTISLLWDAVENEGSTAMVSYRVYEEYDVLSSAEELGDPAVLQDDFYQYNRFGPTLIQGLGDDGTSRGLKEVQLFNRCAVYPFTLGRNAPGFTI